jgi:hypothetical protein
MFSFKENANDVEALIPTEEEELVFVLTSHNLAQSIFYTELRIQNYASEFIWRNT